MKTFTKEQICAYLAKRDLPEEPVFELRKLTILEGGSLDEYCNTLAYFHDYIVRYSDAPKPYLGNFFPIFISNNCSIDRLSYDDILFLQEMFKAQGLNKLVESRGKFNKCLKVFVESENKPSWDLVRVLATDTIYNYIERQKIYDDLLGGGLTSRLNNGDVIKLDDDTYKLPRTIQTEVGDITLPFMYYHFPVIHYTVIGDKLAGYVNKLNKGGLNELDKIKYSLDYNEIILDALIRGEIPIHRLPSCRIVDYNWRPLHPIGDVIFWHEVKPILKARTGRGVPDEPVFMENWDEIKRSVLDAQDESKAETIQPASPTGKPLNKPQWAIDARIIGEEWMLAQEKETGEKPGVIAIAEYVEGELSNRGITGPRGKFQDRETIKREALTGITGRPRNGKKTPPP